ncbi:NIPSNAP family protein [Paenibacillus cremeus]|uniref:NIPSNAP family protein n=1 Tax=Paenibacillus cremeus TaxID=2163881 RepID=A0A559JPV4_9BACL|nr:NIPSNAP family protein [Paenibacillus cremeus]TVY01883.1 NIPSNAP family protein [Paenibacillus cremeus]
MLHELRIYTMYPGRLDAIEQRFSQHTLGIFERLGMKVTDFWIDQTGLPKLYYVMEYADMEERQRQWNAFRTDPEWNEIKRKSEESGPIVEKLEEIFMTRAPYFKA